MNTTRREIRMLTEDIVDVAERYEKKLKDLKIDFKKELSKQLSKQAEKILVANNKIMEKLSKGKPLVGKNNKRYHCDNCGKEFDWAKGAFQTGVNKKKRSRNLV